MAEGLEERIGRLEDIQAITEVLYRYAHHIDRGELDDFLEIFTPDLRYRVRMRNLEGGFDDKADFTGRDALRQFAQMVYQSIWGPGKSGQVNVITQPLITWNGDTATALTYHTLVKGSTEGREVTSYGRYRDELRRCEDGKWRIASRIAEVESVNPK